MSSTADRLTMLRSYPTMASSDDYTDAYLSLALTMAEADIQAYCHRTDTGGDSWDSIVIRYAVIQVNRLGAEGATKAKEGGSIDRDWAEGALPSEIRSLLKPYRLVTGLGDGTGSGGSTGTIDPELDPDSENPVMNKAICAGIATEASDRASAVAALEVRVGDLEAAQATIDTHLDPSSENAVQNQAIAIAVQSVEDSLDEAQRTLQAGISANASAIQGNAQAITAEETARIAADADLQDQIDNIEVTVTIDDAMSTTSENAVQNKVITAAIMGEASARETADNALQAQIDAISSSSDVVDIVGTYAELTSYDTSTLTEGDIVMVLSDNTRQDATTYYRWLTAGGGMWSYVGSEAPSYTKAETDAIVENAVAGKQDALTFDSAPTAGSTNPVTSGGIQTALSGAIKYFRFKAVGTNAPVASITVPASSTYILDVTTGVTSGIGTGYSLLGANGGGFIAVESCNNYEVVPLYSFYYNNKYSVLLKNLSSTDQTITNLWAAGIAVKSDMITQ